MRDIEPQLNSRCDFIDVLATGPGGSNEVQLNLIRIDGDIGCDRNHTESPINTKGGRVVGGNCQFCTIWSSVPKDPVL